MTGRLWQPALAALRVGLALLLGLQALELLLRGGTLFVRLGYPDAARLALGGLEVGAAVLAILPRTFPAGAIGLIAALAWAAGFHFGLHRSSWTLLTEIGLLALLLAARVSSARRKPSVA